MKLNEWIPLSEVSTIPENVQFINCDTRDFHVFLSTEIPNEYIAEIVTDVDAKYLIATEDIIEWIDDLKKKTGGDGDWRHIELKDGHGGDCWLKYIWFVRVTWTHFAMMSRTYNLLETDKILEEIDWSNPYIMTE